MQRIFLTGLCGSGKSTVGRLLAKLLGWDFVHTDDLLSEYIGIPVEKILVEYEQQRLHEIESEILVSAAEQERIIIATGERIVLTEANRTFMNEHGLTVYLQVPIETAWQRIQKHLRYSDPVTETDVQQRLRAIYIAQKTWYEQATLHINTYEHSPDNLACQIVAFAVVHGYLAPSSSAQEVISLNLGRTSSQAIIDLGGVVHLPQIVQSLRLLQRIFIITDTNVGRLYAGPLMTLFERAGFVPHVFTVPAGESSKSFLYMQQILDWLVEHRAERQELLVALGGGVVGDLAGFVAACYLRGIPLIQVPTSLLAQVDSSIGGKTGINHPRGKNLIGTYYQPKLIFVDPMFLMTLPERVYREGLAEIVKYGMILDADLFELLERHVSSLGSPHADVLATTITRCIRLKMDIVQGDERENGLRTILNYGHTFGHALEAVTDYTTWLHGEAVSLGMEVATRIAVASGLLSSEDALRQQKLLSALDLPVHCPGLDIESILAAMQRDKKVRAGHIRWVLPTRIGHAEVYDDIPLALVRDAVAAVCGTQ